jgi:hypothetical protein
LRGGLSQLNIPPLEPMFGSTRTLTTEDGAEAKAEGKRKDDRKL